MRNPSILPRILVALALTLTVTPLLAGHKPGPTPTPGPGKNPPVRAGESCRYPKVSDKRVQFAADLEEIARKNKSGSRTQCTEFGLSRAYDVVDAVTYAGGAFVYGYVADRCTQSVTDATFTNISVYAAQEFWLNIDPGAGVKWMQLGGLATGSQCEAGFAMPDSVTSCTQIPQNMASCKQACMAVVKPAGGAALTLEKLTTVANWLARTDDSCTALARRQQPAPQAQQQQFDWGFEALMDLDSVYSQQQPFAGWIVGQMFASFGTIGTRRHLQEFWILRGENDPSNANDPVEGAIPFTPLYSNCAPRVLVAAGGGITGGCVTAGGAYAATSCTATGATASVMPAGATLRSTDRAVVVVYKLP